MDYFTLRHPELDVSFRNAGMGGDKATNVLARLDIDVLRVKPTVASICLGMNDGLYQPFNQATYDTYMKDMTTLVNRLKAAKVRVVLLSPGCVDPARWCGDKSKPITEYNDTLARFAAGVKELAEREKLPYYNLNALMLDVQTRGKADNKDFVLVPDAVHPQNGGQAVMAYGLLQALGCDDKPSSLTIDAAAGKAIPDRCVIKDLKITPESIAFTRTDAALPAFFDTDVPGFFKYLPEAAEMNRYMFTVKGLKDISWTLSVEGVSLGNYSAKVLAEGVDLNLWWLKAPWWNTMLAVNRLSISQERVDTVWERRDLQAVLAPDQLTTVLKQREEYISKLEGMRRKVAADRTWKWSLTPAVAGK